MAPLGRGEQILERLRRGERIEHYETVRRRIGRSSRLSRTRLPRASCFETVTRSIRLGIILK
jgi:hypothetical protein